MKTFFIFIALLALPGSSAKEPDLYPFRKLYSKSCDLSTHYPSFVRPIDEDLIATYYKEKYDLLGKLPQDASLKTKNQALYEGFSKMNRDLMGQLESYKNQIDIQAKINQKDLERLKDITLDHQVVGTSARKQYDPNGKIGFCFGQSMFAHLFLSSQFTPPVCQSQMLKIFAYGKLIHSRLLWNYHMAVLVLGTDESGAQKIWWVADTLFGKTLTLQEWITEVTNLAVSKLNPDLRFYVSDPRKFQPVFGEYRKTDLNLPEFNHYFEDLEKSLVMSK